MLITHFLQAIHVAVDGYAYVGGLGLGLGP